HRLLDYHGNSLAADAAHGFPACPQKVDAIETYTAGNPQRRRRQPQQGQARQRLAAAAFPNNAKAGSRFKTEMHIPYEQRPGKGISDGQALYFKQAHERSLPTYLGSKASRRLSPKKLNAATTNRIAMPAGIICNGYMVMTSFASLSIM